MKAVILHEPALARNACIGAVLEDELGAAGWLVRTVDVRRATSDDLARCMLLVVGAPTHSLPVPRPRTPHAPRRQPLAPWEHVLNVHEWLCLLDDAFPASTCRPLVAVFRVQSTATGAGAPASVAGQAARALTVQGFEMAGAPATFTLDPGVATVSRAEKARVRSWAREVARKAQEKSRTSRRPRPGRRAITR